MTSKKLSAALLALVCTGSASASFIDHNVEITVLYPDINTVLARTNVPTIARVSASTVEAPALSHLPTMTVDLGANWFEIGGWSGPSAGPITAASFSGVRLSDLDSTIAPVVGVTLDPSTNMPGMTQSRLSFDSDRIWVNFEGLSYSPGVIIRGNVEFGVVPEPSTLLAVSAGATALLSRSRRRG